MKTGKMWTGFPGIKRQGLFLRECGNFRLHTLEKIVRPGWFSSSGLNGILISYFISIQEDKDTMGFSEKIYTLRTQ
ncbi:MAG: hypothetical protein K1W26_04340, partial [Acetatifactor sp.]